MCLSLQLNIILILSTTKKASKLSFCYKLKIYVLVVSTLAFVIKIIRLFSFSAVKKLNFPWSRNFSTVKELFHSQETFPQSRNFSTVMEIFHSHESFPQTRDFSANKSFTLTKEVSQKQILLHSQNNFLRTKIKKVATLLTFKIQKVSHSKDYSLVLYPLKYEKRKFSKGVEKDHWH